MSEPDELYTLRNLFWLGNFQLAITEANGLKKCPANLAGEKKEYFYKSYLGLGQYDVVLGEVSDSDPLALRAVKILATVNSSADSSARDSGIAQIQGWLDDNESMSSQTPSTIASLQLALATLLASDGPQGADLKGAVKCLHTAQTMEHQVMLVQLYLRMDRVDIAQKQVMKMKQIDEDCTLSTMAQAWVNMASQPQKAQEAAYIYEELSDKYGASCLLLNGQAVAKMHLGAYDEAETLLTDALNKTPGDNDTLANLIVVGQHLNRGDDITQRYLTQLKKQAPNHQLVAALATFEGAFDRVGKTLM